MGKTSKGYGKTLGACFTGYAVQSIVINFSPLLFVTFNTELGIPLARITMLITAGFLIQLATDILSIYFVDRIGYRAAAVAAHVFSAAGLAMLSFMPRLFADPFAGLMVSVFFYSVGGGLLEVVVNPIAEACPSDNKAKILSLLHSFYCWGNVAVVLLSTAFFALAGRSNWRVLAVVWAAIPAVNALVFAKVPMPDPEKYGGRGMPVRRLLSDRLFWMFMLMMVCAGASEQAVAQWASAFAEKGLGVAKAVGDLAGPTAFAAMMGVSRTVYGKFGDRIDLNRFISGSLILCLLSYLCVSLVPSPVFGLAGCGLCGLSVGILWPGVLSRASASLRGGTAMFALIALAGDVGCTAGPTLVGFVSSAFSDDLRAGILSAAVFPLTLLICSLLSAGRVRAASGAEKSRR